MGYRLLLVLALSTGFVVPKAILALRGQSQALTLLDLIYGALVATGCVRIDDMGLYCAHSSRLCMALNHRAFAHAVGVTWYLGWQVLIDWLISLRPDSLAGAMFLLTYFLANLCCHPFPSQNQQCVAFCFILFWWCGSTTGVRYSTFWTGEYFSENFFENFNDIILESKYPKYFSWARSSLTDLRQSSTVRMFDFESNSVGVFAIGDSIYLCLRSVVRYLGW